MSEAKPKLKEQTAIFPDKDFNTEFLNSIAFSAIGIEINSCKDLDNAVTELNFLNGKKKDFSKTAQKIVFSATERQIAADDLVEGHCEIINNKINAYCRDKKLVLDFVKQEDGTEQAELLLEHGKVVITRSTKESIKIFPAKEEKSRAA